MLPTRPAVYRCQAASKTSETLPNGARILMGQNLRYKKLGTKILGFIGVSHPVRSERYRPRFMTKVPFAGHEGVASLNTFGKMGLAADDSD